MLKNLIVLPDGTEIFSGEGTVYALQSATITQRVNAGTELTLGSVCANMLEATLLTPAGGLEITTGQELTLYKVDDDGNRTKVGLFTTEEPARPSGNQCKITAYDRISRLDRDLTQFLESLDGWPYTLYDFAQLVCSVCNLVLLNEAIPNGDWQIEKFSVAGVTGRQLMQWVGQACARFCRATPDGMVEFAWYTPNDIPISPTEAKYLQTLQFADYQVMPVDKVQIRQTETDVGAVYGTGSNAYVITGNPLLATDTLAPLQTVAQVLYDTLQAVSYTPCKVRIPATMQIQAGDILHITDRNGKRFSMYVMTKVQSGQTDTLECVGSAYRGSTTATNYAHLTDLNGKVLELQMSMEGLRAENRDMDGAVAGLQLTVDGLSTDVSRIDGVAQRISQVEQTAEGLSVQVQSIVGEGVSKVNTATGYTFDETGITVEKSGREMKTQITDNGMTVYKNGGAVLTANKDGVDAVNLHASTFLVINEKSRFEHYDDRIGCFWVGG